MAYIFWTTLVLLLLYTALHVKGSLVSISTIPRNGPFSITQTVQFTCEVNTTLNVSYNWNYVVETSNVHSTERSFNLTFSNRTIRYTWYVCIASSSGVTFGRATKIIEVHGWLQYWSPQTQLLVRNNTATMNIAVTSAEGYTPSFNLAWYHNGSEIKNSERRRITNNETSLTITNTVGSDAGQYQVKIRALTISHMNSTECDEHLLPLLENLAVNAPATFLLQEQNLPVYDLQGTINTYTIPVLDGDQATLTITSQRTQTSLIYWLQTQPPTIFAFRDGQQLNMGENHIVGFDVNNDTQVTHIMYSNSRDVTGSYVQISNILGLVNYIGVRCPYNYYRFLQMNSIDFSPLIIQYWTITTTSQSPPFITSSKQMPMLLGDNLTLTCLTSSPDDRVIWVHNYTIIDVNSTRILVFPAVLHNNSGVYTCQSIANNILSAPFSVFTQAAASISLITSSKSMPVLLGDYLILTCSSASAKDMVDWFHNATVLTSATSRMLAISSVLPQNLGEYTCRSRSDNISSQSFDVYSNGVDVYEAAILRSAVSSTCNGLTEARDDSLKRLFQFLVRRYEVRPFGRIREYPATSCEEVQDAHYPDHQSGEYWISSHGELRKTYCDF